MTNVTQLKSDNYHQHTLNDSFSCIGPGVHSGLTVVMTVMPAEADSGYVFFRRDVNPAMGEVPARWHTVTDTRLSTTVANRFGIRVSTIEHLMAALHACGIDNARIVLDGPEVPIMDGSAQYFVDLIRQTGRQAQAQPKSAIVITRPIRVEENGAVAMFEPHPVPLIEMSIDFPGTVIGRQTFRTTVDESVFAAELAGARTFGFLQQIEALQRAGLAKGGSLKNAVVVDGQRVVNEEGLRYKDEFVRHKVLDSIGDLALAGTTIIGKFTGEKSGHGLNNQLLRHLMSLEDAWVFTTMQNAASAIGHASTPVQVSDPGRLLHSALFQSSHARSDKRRARS